MLDYVNNHSMKYMTFHSTLEYRINAGVGGCEKSEGGLGLAQYNNNRGLEQSSLCPRPQFRKGKGLEDRLEQSCVEKLKIVIFLGKNTYHLYIYVNSDVTDTFTGEPFVLLDVLLETCS